MFRRAEKPTESVFRPGVAGRARSTRRGSGAAEGRCPEIARDYVVNGGGSSGRGSLLTDKAILDKSPQYQALNEVLKLQHPFPPIEPYDYVYNTILAGHTSAIWTGQEDAKTGMGKAKEEAVKYLKEQGVLK